MAKQGASSDSVSLEDALKHGRATVKKYLPLVGASALTGGIAVGMAASVVALAQSTDPNALVTLLGSLGINWFSQLVWDARNQLAQKSAPTLTKEIAPSIESHLSDERLDSVLRKLDVVTTLLATTPDENQRNTWASEAIARGVISPQTLHEAEAQSGRAVTLNISGMLTNSVALAAGGDINQCTITINGQTRYLEDDVRIYKAACASRIYALPTALDPRSARSAQLSLVNVFVPLHADVLNVPDQSRTRAITGSSEELPRGEQQGPMTILDHLNDHPRAIVLGGPGSGKSTVLKVLALGLCEPDADFTRAWQHNRLLPIYLELRKVTQHVGRACGDTPLGLGTTEHDRAERTLELLLDYVKTHVFTDTHELVSLFNHWLTQRGALWLLDGLDEVPDDWRPVLRSAIALLMERFARCRCVVACRVLTYEADQADGPLTTRKPPHPAELRVRKFTPDQIWAFIGRYFDEVHRQRRLDRDETNALRDGLIAEIKAKDYLADLAQEPLLLTIMAQLHYAEHKLPDSLCELLDKEIAFLLDEWEQQKLDVAPATFATVASAVSTAVSTAVTTAGTGMVDWARDIHRVISANRVAFLQKVQRVAWETYERQTLDIPEADLRDAFHDFLRERKAPAYLNAEHVVRYMRDRSGLIYDEGGKNRIYRFPHKIFHEYLAALWKLGRFADVRAALMRDEDAFAWWRNVYELIALKKEPDGTVSCVEAICPRSALHPMTAVAREGLFLAASIWRNKPVTEDTREQYPTVAHSIDRVQALLLEVMGTPSSQPSPVIEEGKGVAAKTRAEAGNWLARLGEPRNRDHVTTCDAMHFCLVPAGPFILGSTKDADDQAYDDELYGREHDIPYDYLMGRYPVTNAQFAEFVRDPAGYATEKFWAEARDVGVWKAGKVYRQVYYVDDGDVKSKPEGEQGATAPYDFGDPFNLPNHPVVGICWYEMLAFTRWLTARWGTRLQKGWEVSLPSEVEWEKAARGGLWLPRPEDRTPGTVQDILARCSTTVPLTSPNLNPMRRYAYNHDPSDRAADADPERMNFDQTGLSATSAVGCFASGASPYGCEDMNGNVWEWTRSLWGEALREPTFVYPYDVVAERERLDAALRVARVLRGGGYFNDGRIVRCAFRLRAIPDSWDGDGGFRVVVRVCFS